MNAIQFLASQPWVESLGWTLVHFLWQGVLISAVYAFARGCTARSAPGTMYVLACAAMGAMIAAPFVTYLFLPPAASDPVTGAAVTRSASAARPAGLPTIVQVAASAVQPIGAMPWVVTFWFAGAGALSIRLAGGWVASLRLRTVKLRPAPVEWQRRLEELGARIGQSRPVRLMVSGLVHAPCVVGYLRPMVLMPVGALTGLPVAHVEALLVHELAHIVRRDYLVNILQSVAEALLFYHPAVWWVSGHIRREREMCCDDVAVSTTGDVLGYAEALMGMASARLVAPELALGADGGSLSARIARLLGRPRPASRRPAGVGAVLLVVATALFAQAPARPKFEVAAIKPSAETRFMSLRPQPGRLTANAPVRLMIQNAYGLQPFQIIGGPRWIETDYYDIDAKAEGSANRAQVLLMLQSLLEDRFQLKAKQETRELPVYALLPARGGLKLTTREGSCVSREPNVPPSPPLPGTLPCGSGVISMTPAGGRFAGGKVSMSEFTRVLANMLGRRIIDQTGFTGTFDFKLDFTPDASTSGLPGNRGGADAVPADVAPPSIFTSLQETLGLRLESTKGPVEVLVIDSVQRPTAN